MRPKQREHRTGTRRPARTTLAHHATLIHGTAGSAGVGIITTDSRQRILAVNPAACTMFGYAPDELLWKPLARLLPGSSHEAMALRADGTAFPVDVAVSRVQIGHGQLFTAVIRDISEHHRAEEVLRYSEASLRHLLHALPEAVRLMQDDRLALAARSPESGSDGAVGTVALRGTAELALARQALSDSHATLRRLIAAQDQLQEDERKRIARELHDDLQQALAAIRFDITAAADRILTALPDVALRLGETSELAGTAIESTRRIINDLRPQMLEDLGLIDALEALMTQFRSRFRVDAVFSGTDDCLPSAPLPAALATCLYRAAQEALGNVAKHARADRVELTYRRSWTGDILLRVRDDGCGTATTAPRHPTSFGILGMQERVLAVGGTLTIASTPGVGTTVEVRASGPAAAKPPGPSPAALRRPARRPPRAGPRAQTSEDPPAHLLPAMIDALGGNVALIDRQGTIVLVNRAWRAFAALGGDPDMRACGPGTNYLDVCRRSAVNDALALAALRGVTHVLDGVAPEFSMEYPCNSPTQARWYRMHIAPIDSRRFLVTHVNLDRMPRNAPSGTTGQ